MDFYRNNKADIKNQNVIQLEFDKDNVLKNVYLFGVSDKNEIVMSQKDTETFGKEISFFEQIISFLIKR